MALNLYLQSCFVHEAPEQLHMETHLFVVRWCIHTVDLENDCQHQLLQVSEGDLWTRFNVKYTSGLFKKNLQPEAEGHKDCFYHDTSDTISKSTTCAICWLPVCPSGQHMSVLCSGD